MALGSGRRVVALVEGGYGSLFRRPTIAPRTIAPRAALSSLPPAALAIALRAPRAAAAPRFTARSALGITISGTGRAWTSPAAIANELGEPREFLPAQLPVAITIEPDEKRHEVRTLGTRGTSPRTTATVTAALTVGATLTRSTAIPTIAICLAPWAARLAVLGCPSIARTALASAATRTTLSVDDLLIVASIFTLSVFALSPLAPSPIVSLAGAAPAPGFTEVLRHRLPFALIERATVIFVERIQKALTEERPSLRITDARFLFQRLRHSG